MVRGWYLSITGWYEVGGLQVAAGYRHQLPWNTMWLWFLWVAWSLLSHWYLSNKMQPPSFVQGLISYIPYHLMYWQGSVLVFHLPITNYHQCSSLKQYPFTVVNLEGNKFLLVLEVKSPNIKLSAGLGSLLRLEGRICFLFQLLEGAHTPWLMVPPPSSKPVACHLQISLSDLCICIPPPPPPDSPAILFPL